MEYFKTINNNSIFNKSQNSKKNNFEVLRIFKIQH